MSKKTKQSQTDKSDGFDGIKSFTYYVFASLVLILFFAGLLYLFAKYSKPIGNQGGNSTYNSTQSSDDAIEQLNNEIDSKYSDLTDAVINMQGDIDVICVWMQENINYDTADYCIDAMRSGNFPSGGLTSWSSSSIEYDEEASISEKLDFIVSAANNRYNAVLDAAGTISSEMDGICSWLYDNAGGDIADECTDASQIDGSFSRDPFSASNYYPN